MYDANTAKVSEPSQAAMEVSFKPARLTGDVHVAVSGKCLQNPPEHRVNLSGGGKGEK